MIVDDEPLNLKMLKFILKKAFLNVNIIEARDGVEGIELFKKFNNRTIFDEKSISLIVTDLNMPNMDGWKMSL